MYRFLTPTENRKQTHVPIFPAFYSPTYLIQYIPFFPLYFRLSPSALNIPYPSLHHPATFTHARTYPPHPHKPRKKQIIPPPPLPKLPSYMPTSFQPVPPSFCTEKRNKKKSPQKKPKTKSTHKKKVRRKKKSSPDGTTVRNESNGPPPPSPHTARNRNPASYSFFSLQFFFVGSFFRCWLRYVHFMRVLKSEMYIKVQCKSW